MIPLFDRAISNAKEYLARSDTYRNHLRELKKVANKRKHFSTFRFILTTPQHESYNNSGGSMSLAHKESSSSSNSPTEKESWFQSTAWSLPSAKLPILGTSSPTEKMQMFRAQSVIISMIRPSKPCFIFPMA